LREGFSKLEEVIEFCRDAGLGYLRLSAALFYYEAKQEAAASLALPPDLEQVLSEGVEREIENFHLREAILRANAAFNSGELEQAELFAVRGLEEAAASGNCWVEMSALRLTHKIRAARGMDVQTVSDRLAALLEGLEASTTSAELKTFVAALRFRGSREPV